jgi:hypothetical protein
LSAFWPGLEVSIGNVGPAAELHLQYYTIWSYYEAIPDITSLENSALSTDGSSYPLRPELIESTYYLFAATRNPLYLKAAERMAKDINRRCRVTCGFATLKDVAKRRNLTDEMESFFLSETLKYLYFTFSKGVEVFYQEAQAYAN